MNKKIFLLVIVIAFLFLSVNNSCNSIEQENKVDTVVIVIHDTVEILQKFDDECYNKNLDFCKSEYEEFYQLIKSSRMDANFNKKLASENIVPSFIVTGMLFKDTIIFDATILYYLKIYEQNLLGDMHGFNITCCDDNNKYTLLLHASYCIGTGTDPSASLFTKEVYQWIKDNEYHLKNKDIFNKINSIDSLKKAGYHIPQ